MILHKVGVLVDVNGLQGQLPQPLSSVTVALRSGSHTTAPSLSSSPMLEIHLCCVMVSLRYQYA